MSWKLGIVYIPWIIANVAVAASQGSPERFETDFAIPFPVPDSWNMWYVTSLELMNWELQSSETNVSSFKCGYYNPDQILL